MNWYITMVSLVTRMKVYWYYNTQAKFGFTEVFMYDMMSLEGIMLVK